MASLKAYLAVVPGKKTSSEAGTASKGSDLLKFMGSSKKAATDESPAPPVAIKEANKEIAKTSKKTYSLKDFF
jgi:hypothetical protein